MRRRELRRRLVASQRRVVLLEGRVRTLEALVAERTRDAELLACGWRDKQAALAFIKQAHDIDRINELRGVAS